MPECLQCGWVWISRVKRPKTCPKCKAWNWKKAPVSAPLHVPVLSSPSQDFIQIGDIEQRRDNPAILQ